MKRIMVGILVLLVMGVWGTGQVGAACTGVTKCGVQDTDGNCPTDDYTTKNCTPVGDACYAYDCSGGAGCDKGDTCGTAGGGGTLLCADATQPYCSQGYCDAGKVCVSTGTTGCGCSNTFSCSDVVNDPAVTVTRLGDGPNVTVSWNTQASNIHVIKHKLAVGRTGPGALLCMNGDLSKCLYRDINIPKTTGTADIIGVLEPGRYYVALVQTVTDVKKNQTEYCEGTTYKNLVSSCILPDASIPRGSYQYMDTQFFETTTDWKVGYVEGDSRIVSVTTPDLVAPFRTKATGLLDGLTTVLNRVRKDTELLCEYTADVAVGNCG